MRIVLLGPEKGGLYRQVNYSENCTFAPGKGGLYVQIQYQGKLRRTERSASLSPTSNHPIL